MNIDMLLKELAGPQATLPEGTGETDICGLTADSREVEPGYLFAALPGTKVDGGLFIKDALARGAAAILSLPESARVTDLGAIPCIQDENPRKRLAQLAARFYPRQPEVVVAVTGTNGKTSVASFTRQIWDRLGQPAASLGTLGAEGPKGQYPLHHTTPDPVTLHRVVDALTGDGAACLALEASSHGLAQYRLDGMRLKAAAFTNISRDHLDYHENFEDYLRAKMRLFEDLLPADGVAVLCADGGGFDEVFAVCESHGLKVITVGVGGRDICLRSLTPKAAGQSLEVDYDGTSFTIALPLAGDFQATNALVAAGLVIASGGEPKVVFSALEHLEGVPGRLELAGRLDNGAAVYVDYAHTPDALSHALTALRAHADGKLRLIFGCGGDRDKGKRPQMGRVAAELSDEAIVADDNPRNENAAQIRREILAACPGAGEIGDRRAAIAAGVAALDVGDILLVAGKGHESGQVVGETVHPFDDVTVVREALKEREPLA